MRLPSILGRLSVLQQSLICAVGRLLSDIVNQFTMPIRPKRMGWRKWKDTTSFSLTSNNGFKLEGRIWLLGVSVEQEGLYCLLSHLTISDRPTLSKIVSTVY